MMTPAAYTSDFYERPETRTAGLRPAERGMAAGSAALSAAGEGETGGFWEVLKGLVDIVNPLHHIPVVGSLYRAVTGDTIGAVAKVAGGALYGGPVGGAVSLATEVARGAITGKTGAAETASALQPLSHPSHSLASDGIIWNETDLLKQNENNGLINNYTKAAPPSESSANTVNIWY